jgi:hypothetical protein
VGAPARPSNPDISPATVTTPATPKVLTAPSTAAIPSTSAPAPVESTVAVGSGAVASAPARE